MILRGDFKAEGCWLLGVCSIRVLAKNMAILIMNPLSWFVMVILGYFKA